MRGHVDEFRHIQATAQQPKILVEGTQGLEHVHTVHAIQRLPGAPIDNGIEQHQGLVIARCMAPVAVTATRHSAQLPELLREENNNLIALAQFVRV